MSRRRGDEASWGDFLHVEREHRNFLPNIFELPSSSLKEWWLIKRFQMAATIYENAYQEYSVWGSHFGLSPSRKRRMRKRVAKSHQRAKVLAKRVAVALDLEHLADAEVKQSGWR